MDILAFWGEGRPRGEAPFCRKMRPNGGRKAVPVTTQEVTGIDSRDATEWRPQGRAVLTGSYARRQHSSQ